MLSAYDGQGAVTDALRAGASGYLLKSAGADQLIAAIRAVRAGESYLTPALTGPLVGQAVRADGQAAGTGIRALTFREREVLQRLAEGLSAPEIATELHITRRTVETHRASVMRKLGIRKTAGLVRFAIREGLLPA
jgi:two-component system NarL family response regulator